MANIKSVIGITVELSSGEKTFLDLQEFAAQANPTAWVADETGLSVNSFAIDSALDKLELLAEMFGLDTELTRQNP